jgi:hypothetical protein
MKNKASIGILIFIVASLFAGLPYSHARGRGDDREGYYRDDPSIREDEGYGAYPEGVEAEYAVGVADISDGYSEDDGSVAGSGDDGGGPGQ